MRVLFLFVFISFSSIARVEFFDTFPVIQEGHPTLRLDAQDLEVSEISSQKNHKLIRDMFETMKRNTGVGLAAPQINLSKNIFVMGSFLAGVKKRVMINPEVELIGEASKLSKEGCLSTVDFGKRKVPRHKRVFVKYYDEHGRYFEKEFSGFTAIVIQHEYDHLRGRLIIDYEQGLHYLWKELEEVEIPFEV